MDQPILLSIQGPNVSVLIIWL